MNKRIHLHLLVAAACVSLAFTPFPAETILLQVWLDRPPSLMYHEGDKVIVSVKASKQCYLQVFYHDAAGKNYRIFPNQASSPDGVIQPHKEIVLGKDVNVDGFEFEVTAPFGAEMIRAYATSVPLPAPEGKTMDGGMIAVKKSLDDIDMWFTDEADKKDAVFATSSVLLKTAPRGSIAGREPEAVSGKAPKASGAPRIFGLVVGVSSYSSSRIKYLKYAQTDAKLVSDFLAHPDGVGIPEERLQVLLNEKATRANILEAFNDFLGKTTKQDLVVIYFAGHGLTSPNDNATFFMSHDADLERLKSTAVDQAEITSLLTDKVPAGKVVFLIDACHGGGLGLTGVRLRGATTVLSTKLLTELVTNKNGTAFFSASRAMEQSHEGDRWGGGHGVFTHYLVQGLKKDGDSNKDGRVTISELADYVSDMVKRDTMGKQHPELKGYFDNELVLSVLK